ncbi:cell division inhibitor SepF [Micrococcales bacterium KH10]|nr:cell division inhibitor SepF [Micrococcales bacterium KH10]
MAAGALRKTMLYLGLSDGRAEDEDAQYDETDEYYDEVEREVPSDYDAPVTPLRPSNERHAAAGDLRRITTIHPRSYNDARAIGEAFRAGTPVIMNVSDMSDADAKRLVDFSAGLIFGLHGSIERVTSKVFLLSPETVEITGDESTRDGSRAGFYNQS